MSDQTALAADWRSLGCVRMARVAGGRAAWRRRAVRTSPTVWVIEAAHRPYLGQAPYDYGGDAWRISIQSPRLVEVAHLIVRSEADAHETVAWLVAVAEEDDR